MNELKRLWEIYFQAAGIGVRDYLDYLILPEFSSACVIFEKKGATPTPRFVRQLGAATGMSSVLVLDGEPEQRAYNDIPTSDADEPGTVILARVRGEYSRMWGNPSDVEVDEMPKDTGEIVTRALDAVQRYKDYWSSVSKTEAAK